MKNRMPTRKSLGKVSTYLKTMTNGGHRRSERRAAIRATTFTNNLYPNSTKVGAGEVTARRSLPQTIHHKRDHRSNVIIKVA